MMKIFKIITIIILLFPVIAIQTLLMDVSAAPVLAIVSNTCPSLPTVTTTTYSSLTSTTATSGGNITADGGSTVTERGVCWATSSFPEITDNKTSDGSGTGTFTSNITGLLTHTTYYARAYATNSAGTAYGNEISFQYLAVREAYQGGIIGYIFTSSDPGYDPLIKHGIIAAITDLSGFVSYSNMACSTPKCAGLPYTLKQGRNNSDYLLLTSCVPTTSAAPMCATLSLGGYRDWFLPSAYELQKITNNLNWTQTGGYSGPGYMINNEFNSSGEFDATKSYTVTASTGVINSTNFKGTGLATRCIRYF